MGESDGTVSGFSSTENVDVTLSGASTVTGDISAGDMNFKVSGASTVQLKGSAIDIVAEVSGASSFNAGGLAVKNVNVSLSGASTGTVNPGGRLDADLSGASKLEYIGEPTLGKVNISGASNLNKK